MPPSLLSIIFILAATLSAIFSARVSAAIIHGVKGLANVPAGPPLPLAVRRYFGPDLVFTFSVASLGGVRAVGLVVPTTIE